MSRHLCAGMAGATLVLTVAVAGAAPVCDGTDACLRAIEASQRATRSLSARFVQTKRLSLMAEPLVSHGQFAFKVPDQVLWQIDDPKVTVRIDTQGVHLTDLPNAQAEVAALAPFGEMMRELSGVFRGSLTELRSSFDVVASGGPSAVSVHLVPRRAQWQRMFRALDLSFATPDMVMQSMHLDEALGDSLEIVFTEIHRNDAVSDAAVAVGDPVHD